ncbi:annexin B11 isoform X1 [Drosophila pseudoobscura]|uniref:Annexin n=1 Tax=Drosophila pseudoobscura pseudoobscura TaxID=46245 RepID=A0A6I8WDH7_DROPS|nr:annexin B11 isoform X1 [Drosophila pseudoobscura]XP_033241444.1 annexin B11 isoform X1 [Drosophila pseudoobscura]
MYPFGSGMPYSSHPPTTNEPPPNAAPFGAGWVPPMQQNSPYSSTPPYPPQPSHHQPHQPHQPHQYPPSQHGGYPPYPASSASASASYPYPNSNPYPMTQSHPSPSPSHSHSHNIHQLHGGAQTAPYPYPGAQPATNSPYPTGSGFTPAMTAGYDAGHGHGHGHGQWQGQWHGHEHGHGHAHRSPTAHKEGTPTLFPAQGFDPVKDAHDLRKAMKGFGTDENALINIICRRTNEQRQEIQRQYKTHFGKDLIEDIKSETSGNFEKLLVGLLQPIVDYYCAELNDAMAGIGTDEEVLIEILCTLSNMEIYTIKNQYLRLYGAHLESELKSETSGNFKRLLTSLCTAARDESGRIDPDQAKDDARELLKAGELRVGTDESMFNMILCQRNYAQLKMIFQEYEGMTGHSLEKAIKKEFSGDIMEGLIAIFRCVTNKADYFASRLHKAMAGIGTNDTQLIRVIITRCEIDMSDIKVAFERLYGKSLKSWIKGDTSGHYKHALYALVGEQRSS